MHSAAHESPPKTRIPYTTDVCRIVSHVLKIFFRQTGLGFCAGFQRFPQFVFDFFDSGLRTATTACHPAPIVPALLAVGTGFAFRAS